ncbi:hypothetical protein KA005_56460, partial [bacterium]|nr:hypothetical protein [bacterium]
YNDGGVGPGALTEESASTKKTHGDVVMADALTLDDSELPKIKHQGAKAPVNSCGYRRQQVMKKKKVMKARSWRSVFDFGKGT